MKFKRRNILYFVGSAGQRNRNQGEGSQSSTGSNTRVVGFSSSDNQRSYDREGKNDISFMLVSCDEVKNLSKFCFIKSICEIWCKKIGKGKGNYHNKWK